jgi:hypothetical protein
MNSTIPGAAAILAGALASPSISHFRISGNTVETFLRETRSLSESGLAALHEIRSGKDPASGPPDAHLSKGDITNIFWNSRRFVCFANHARLCNPEDTELGAMFEIMWNDHAKLRWQIILSMIESILGKLGLGQITIYSGLLLWTYGEELELLDQISQKCGLEGTAIRAIL